MLQKYALACSQVTTARVQVSPAVIAHNLQRYLLSISAARTFAIPHVHNTHTRATVAGIWNQVYLVPGETSLAFYTATNPTDNPVIGISTYNVIPYDAGQYFNKIQCFCFEEQMLGP